MTKDEALRMAIDALCRAWDTEEYWKTMTSALQACKEALAQPTAEQSSLVQEPVAWMNDIAFSMDKELLGTRSRIVPLYTTPPSREWQGLSDDEIDKIYCEVSDNCVKYFPSELYVAWFKALREKNDA